MRSSFAGQILRNFYQSFVPDKAYETLIALIEISFSLTALIEFREDWFSPDSETQISEFRCPAKLMTRPSFAEEFRSYKKWPKFKYSVFLTGTQNSLVREVTLASCNGWQPPVWKEYSESGGSDCTKVTSDACWVSLPPMTKRVRRRREWERFVRFDIRWMWWMCVNAMLTWEHANGLGDDVH